MRFSLWWSCRDLRDYDIVYQPFEGTYYLHLQGNTHLDIALADSHVNVSVSKQHWPTVRCWSGALPVVCFICEHCCVRYTGIQSERFRLATVFFEVWSWSEDLTTLLHSSTLITGRLGLGSLNRACIVVLTHFCPTRSRPLLYTFWFLICLPVFCFVTHMYEAEILSDFFFAWMWNLVTRVKGRTLIGSVWEQEAEETGPKRK
jgi:hypothetical protein